MKKTKIFKAPGAYIQSVRHYSIMDTMMALGLFILYCGAMAVSGLVSKHLTTLERTVSSIMINSCFAGIVLLFLAVKKQGIETVGFSFCRRRK